MRSISGFCGVPYGLIVAAALIVSPVVRAEIPSMPSRLHTSVFLTSDYRFSGMSMSDRGPAWQASAYWWRPDDFYAGVWLSRVDLAFPQSPSVAVDVYGGRRFHRGRTEVRIEVMYSWFDYSEPGPDLDFFQMQLRASQPFGPLTLQAEGKWSPDGSFAAGTTWHLAGKAAWSITEWLDASTRLGHAWVARQPNRTYWDAGFTARWQQLALDVRYVNTTLDGAACAFTDWCEGAVTATLSLDLPYLELW